MIVGTLFYIPVGEYVPFTEYLPAENKKAVMKFDPDKICFGLSEELDRQSFATFLWLSGQPDFAETLSARVSSEEIDTHVTAFMSLLKKHLDKQEYHRLFLQDQDHHPH